MAQLQVYRVLEKQVAVKCNVHGNHFSYIHAATVDYIVTSSDLTFNATTSSQTVTIPILEDNLFEGSETIIVTLTSADPAAILNPSTTSVTIEDNDGEYSTVSHSHLLR